MKTLTLSLLFFCIGLQAQVGIGNTDPKATLDITGQPTVPTELDGVIAPRLTGDQLGAKTYTTAQTAALVYVTAADTTPSGQTIDVTAAGYYYFNGTKWTIVAPSNDWKITGNSGTTAATNFLGTTDDVNLIFKRNNIQAGLLSTPSTAYGVNSLLASTGIWNTAIGETALQNTTTGHRNTAVGSGAMTDNTTGYHNTALGRYSLHFITTGFNNMAIGQEAAKWNSTGHDNTAIGFNALRNNNTGSYNVAVGRSAMSYDSTPLIDDTEPIGNNNIAIGTNAQLPNPTASNQMVLGGAAGSKITEPVSGIETSTATLTTIINGFITAPTTTNAQITAEPTGKALVTKEYLGTYAPLASPTFTGVVKTPRLNLTGISVYASNAAAITGGLAVGDVYRTSTGVLMIRY